MGEGGLCGVLPSVLIVAERRGLFANGVASGVGLTAVFGGGGAGACVAVSNNGLLRESLRKTLVPRSDIASENGRVGLCENRLATVTLALRACVATGISFSGSSSSNSGAAPNLRLKGNAAVVLGAFGDWARK